MKKGKLNTIFLMLLVIFAIGVCTSSCTDYQVSVNESAAPKTEIEYPLEVHFIDVGQADSIYIKLPDDKHMLIDAGNNKDGESVCEYLEGEGVKYIDYLVGTHPHADHIGGMDTVINNFDIGKIYMPKVYRDTKTYEEVLQAIKDNDYKIITAKKGVTIFDEGNIRAEIISPAKDKYDEVNNYSAVIRLTFGDTVYLFTGDAEKEVEYELLEREDVKCDVLKVAHHGSDTSSTSKFIKKASPRYAVICVGEGNEYGHPSKKVINLIMENGAEIYRTDKDGDVIFLSDGKNIDVITRK